MLPQENWRGLIRPRKLEPDSKELTATYGKFVAEPLERGFGITLGNALRRVLLSSLQGCAVTAVRIDGVLHEFSTLPGVREDVADIILNLKEVRFKMDEGHEAMGRVDVRGERVVTAADIVLGPHVQVLNPEQHIATLSRDGRLQMDLTVKLGRGYVPAERNKDETAPVGTIPIDAVFSPIRKVNFTVTNARVAQRTDYDRLTLEVWTDGSVKPDDAIAYAARILQDQLGVFINFVETQPVEEAKEAAKQPQFNENLFRSVAELDLSVRAANCLQNAGIKYIGELVQKTEQEMLKTKNFGRKSLNEIKEILRQMGLELGMKLENFPSRAELDARWAREKESA
ncbi:MAG: DNA-directed RNA polymerase subunit alpha [Candidatus Binatia bacterium]|nr:MAG: DNA-directed RNA polymerase subunit alpha [Candidatus Binatia bacterium]